MGHPKLTKLELQVMDALWQKGVCSVREIQETFPRPGRPAYTTVQTTVYRLERKKALRCVKRISNANMFEASISREQAHRRLIDDLLALIGPGSAQVVTARLREIGSTKRTQIAASGYRLQAPGATERQNEPKQRTTRMTKRSQAGG